MMEFDPEVIYIMFYILLSLNEYFKITSLIFNKKYLDNAYGKKSRGNNNQKVRFKIPKSDLVPLVNPPLLGSLPNQHEWKQREKKTPYTFPNKTDTNDSRKQMNNDNGEQVNSIRKAEQNLLHNIIETAQSPWKIIKDRLACDGVKDLREIEKQNVVQKCRTPFTSHNCRATDAEMDLNNKGEFSVNQEIDLSNFTLFPCDCDYHIQKALNSEKFTVNCNQADELFFKICDKFEKKDKNFRGMVSGSVCNKKTKSKSLKPVKDFNNNFGQIKTQVSDDLKQEIVNILEPSKTYNSNESSSECIQPYKPDKNDSIDEITLKNTIERHNLNENENTEFASLKKNDCPETNEQKTSRFSTFIKTKLNEEQVCWICNAILSQSCQKFCTDCKEFLEKHHPTSGQMKNVLGRQVDDKNNHDVFSETYLNSQKEQNDRRNDLIQLGENQSENFDCIKEGVSFNGKNGNCTYSESIFKDVQILKGNKFEEFDDSNLTEEIVFDDKNKKKNKHLRQKFITIPQSKSEVVINEYKNNSIDKKSEKDLKICNSKKGFELPRKRKIKKTSALDVSFDIKSKIINKKDSKFYNTLVSFENENNDESATKTIETKLSEKNELNETKDHDKYDQLLSKHEKCLFNNNNVNEKGSNLNGIELNQICEYGPDFFTNSECIDQENLVQTKKELNKIEIERDKYHLQDFVLNKNSCEFDRKNNTKNTRNIENELLLNANNESLDETNVPELTNSEGKIDKEINLSHIISQIEELVSILNEKLQQKMHNLGLDFETENHHSNLENFEHITKEFLPKPYLNFSKKSDQKLCNNLKNYNKISVFNQENNNNVNWVHLNTWRSKNEDEQPKKMKTASFVKPDEFACGDLMSENICKNERPSGLGAYCSTSPAEICYDFHFQHNKEEFLSKDVRKTERNFRNKSSRTSSPSSDYDPHYLTHTNFTKIKSIPNQSNTCSFTEIKLADGTVIKAQFLNNYDNIKHCNTKIDYREQNFRQRKLKRKTKQKFCRKFDEMASSAVSSRISFFNNQRRENNVITYSDHNPSQETILLLMYPKRKSKMPKNMKHCWEREKFSNFSKENFVSNQFINFDTFPRKKQFTGVPVPTMNGSSCHTNGDLNGCDIITQNQQKGCWTIGLINSKFKYLTAETFGHKINANGTSLKKKQIWTLEPDLSCTGESYIFLKSHLDKYLAVDSFGNVTCENEEKDPGSKFLISVAEDGTGRWAFRNVVRGYFLGASQDKLTCTAKIPGDAEFWHVHLAARPQVNLRSVGRKRFAHLSDNQDEIYVDANIPWGEDTLFTLEFRADESGKYALHTCNNKYLSLAGKLVDKCSSDCLFSAEYHSGFLALRDKNGAYLSPIGSKAVLKTRSNTVTKDELFSLEDSLPQASFVAALNSKYVSVKQGVDVTANQDEISDHETFQLEFDWSTKRWYIRTMQDRYWTLETGGGIQAVGDKRSSNALFDLVWQGDGSVALRANNGRYVTTKRSGHLYANSDGIDENSKYFFYLINRPILVLKCEQGFVGYKAGNNAKLECNKATYETIRVERAEKGVVYLKGQNGKYWHCDSECVMADSDTPEGFYLELREPTRLSIKSVNGSYLTASKNGVFRLGDSSYESATQWEY